VIAKASKPAEGAHLENLPVLRDNSERVIKAFLAPLQMQVCVRASSVVHAGAD
jgi:hypothetical protein